MGWIVKPDDDVSISDNGLITLPCKSDDIEYEITFVNSNGCSSNTVSYWYWSSGCTDCDCTQLILTPRSTDISSDSSADVVLGTYSTRDLCLTGIAATPVGDTANWVSQVRTLSNGNIIGNVTANDSLLDRTGTIKVTANECTSGKTIQFAQVGRACPTEFIKRLSNIDFQYEGAYCVALAVFKNNLSEYTTAITVSLSDGENISVCTSGSTWQLDNSWNLIQITVPANPNTVQRTITITCTLTKGSSICSEYVQITQEASPSCTCSDLSFKGSYDDVPVLVTAYNDYANQIYVFDVGLKVDGAWNYAQVDQGYGEADYLKEKVVAILSFNESDIGKTITNASATIGQNEYDSGVEYCQMEFSPTTIARGAVIRLTWDGDWSGSHHSCEEPVVGDGKIKVNVDVNPGATSPAVHFLDSSNTQLLGVTRYTTDTEITSTWKTTTGTCTKLQFVEMGGNYTRLTITLQKIGQAPITLLQNGTIPSTSGSYLSLDRNFKIEDYYDSSTCTIYLTFR